MSNMDIVPLIIGGEDIVLTGKYQGEIASPVPNGPTKFQGATTELAIKAVESSASAFASWSKTRPQERRAKLLQLATVLRQRATELEKLVDEEIHCGELWAHIIMQGGIELVEETAALITTSTMGCIPATDKGSYGLVLKEPLGVVLGIAPWNAPVILGLRAVVAPVAVGNTAILKGSELSPRTHYMLASLFREAGFPPGVVNYVCHRPEDASDVYDSMITQRAVKKCNFTGSTAVGRIIASRAAQALKPVLLELGGKNYALVLDDADLDLAAEHIVRGAFLNNGQICMSTDLVISSKSINSALESKILALLDTIKTNHTVISQPAKTKLENLLSDSRTKGASIHSAATSTDGAHFPATLIRGVTPSMDFFHTESFGPVLGMVTVDHEDDIAALIQEFDYGLSSAIFTRNHHRALGLAASVNAGAVHVNAMTVHDEATLPHGGVGHSGWGRFGAGWGLEEFLQTKTVTLNG
ncbi:putative aldehyde dehydrogenase [Aspergillus candidus]|uniref:Aldehyde dehydrogenase n=1 Tax=Aspergillus candidus TaxID=41067 RepID=A0A2I2F7L5_ASPCN|nr:aldehyde dehydrogenase [Aspergillus candidus]PLB36615.1 aldehyde dehydrogenase [Aspergillus candidus]